VRKEVIDGLPHHHVHKRNTVLYYGVKGWKRGLRGFAVSNDVYQVDGRYYTH